MDLEQDEAHWHKFLLPTSSGVPHWNVQCNVEVHNIHADELQSQHRTWQQHQI